MKNDRSSSFTPKSDSSSPKSSQESNTKGAHFRLTPEYLENVSEDCKTVLDLSGVMFVALDANGKVCLINRRGQEILGRRSEDIIGKDWFAVALPQDLRTQVKEVFHKLMADEIEPVEYYENPLVNSNGELRTIAWHNTVLRDENGVAIGSLSSGEDITDRVTMEGALRAANQQLRASEQQLRAANQQLNAANQQLKASEQSYSTLAKKTKESEERFRTLAEQSLFGIEIIQDNTILFANERIAHMLDYDTPDDVMDMPAADMKKHLSETDFERIHCTSAAHMCGEIWKGEEYEIEMVTTTGDKRWIRVALKTIEYNGLPAVFASFVDLTETKRIEEELRKSQRLESLGVLAGGIAHDFNNLLGGLFGYVDMARTYGDVSETVADYLDCAMGAYTRAKDLTQQLLTFSKGGAPRKQKVAVNEVVRQAANLSLIGGNVRCSFQIPSSMWAVDGDAGQLSQVISNLVLNARHAMPQGGAIRIVARNVELSEDRVPKSLRPGAYVEISVTDSGTGIPHEHLDRIFDPFFTTKQEGSGLGLATSYSIISKHHGHIEVESELGKGSTFRIYLPAVKAVVTCEGNSESAVEHSGNGRILIMDDELLVLEMATEMLNGLGYSVTAVEDGRKAVELYKVSLEEGRPFAAVILDLTVAGGMGGKEACGSICSIDPEAKTIVSSGYADDPVLANPHEHGFTAVVAKPYRVRDLGAVLDSVLNSDA